MNLARNYESLKPEVFLRCTEARYCKVNNTLVSFFEHMVDGRLIEILRRKQEPLPELCSIYILHVVIEALHAMHQQHIIHG